MKGKRTIIFGVLVTVLGALQAVQLTDWMELVGDQAAGAITSGIGVAILVLRYLTTTPIGTKE